MSATRNPQAFPAGCTGSCADGCEVHPQLVQHGVPGVAAETASNSNIQETAPAEHLVDDHAPTKEQTAQTPQTAKTENTVQNTAN
ncbi:hypothetical protein IAU60_002296 [Kwoniella sp. DSM 27419]